MLHSAFTKTSSFFNYFPPYCYLPGIMILFLPITSAFPEHRAYVKCDEVIPVGSEGEGGEN